MRPPQPWAQEILVGQLGRLEAFASEAVGSPVQIDTRRLVGRGLYGSVFDLYFRDGRHTGYVLKLTSDWSELLGWSWLQRLNLPGVPWVLAVGKGRTEVESPSGMALPTVIVREKVGGWSDYPDPGIAHEVGLALDAWRADDGRTPTGSHAPAAALARRLMGIEHAQAAGAAILRLLKSNLVPHDLNKDNFGWREDGTLVILDPSVDTADPPVRKPRRVPTVLKNPPLPPRRPGWISPYEQLALKRGFVPLDPDSIGRGTEAPARGWQLYVSPQDRDKIMAWARDYEALAREVDRRYRSGQVDGVEDLEARASHLEHLLEHALEEASTSEEDLATGEDTRDLADLDGQVADLYHQFVHSEPGTYSRFEPFPGGPPTREGVLADTLRHVIAHAHTAHGGTLTWQGERSDPWRVPDQQLIEAAADLYRRRLALRARYGRKAKDFPARPQIPPTRENPRALPAGWDLRPDAAGRSNYYHVSGLAQIRDHGRRGGHVWHSPAWRYLVMIWTGSEWLEIAAVKTFPEAILIAERDMGKPVTGRNPPFAGDEYVLAPPGMTTLIGPERGRPKRDGIARYVSPHGSTRYVLYESGVPLAGLQVMSRDGKSATIAFVYTVPARRRQRLAERLLWKAREEFATVEHSHHLTEHGQAWKRGIGENPRKLVAVNPALLPQDAWSKRLRFAANVQMRKNYDEIARSATAGGCWIVGEALRRIFGGKLEVVIEDAPPENRWCSPIVHHVVLRLPDGRLLDGDGLHDDPAMLRKAHASWRIADGTFRMGAIRPRELRDCHTEPPNVSEPRFKDLVKALRAVGPLPSAKNPPARAAQPAPRDDRRYSFVTSCLDSTFEDIQALKASASSLPRPTFVRKLAPGEWALVQKSLGYGPDFPITKDKLIGYYRGIFRGVPAVFLTWSGIEHVFTLDGQIGTSASRDLRGARSVPMPMPFQSGRRVRPNGDAESRRREREARAIDDPQRVAVLADLERRRRGEPSELGWLADHYFAFDLEHEGGRYVPSARVLWQREIGRQRGEVNAIGKKLYGRLFWSEDDGGGSMSIGYRDNRSYPNWLEREQQLAAAIQAAGYVTFFADDPHGRPTSLHVRFNVERARLAHDLHEEYVSLLRAAREAWRIKPKGAP